MKSYLIMAAAFCLAACSKQEILPSTSEQEVAGDDEYILALSGPEAMTKGDESISEVDFYLADLESNYSVSRLLTATLFRKEEGGNWQKVTSADYSWNDPGADYYRYSNDADNHMYHHLDAIKEGRGVKLTASGIVGGRTVATSDPIEVIVNDNRTLEWSSCDTALDGGETGSAILSSNFTGKVTITASNGVLIGTSTNPVSSSTTVTFDSSHKTHTLYYKYNGEVQVTSLVSALSEVDASLKDCFDLEAEPKIYHYKITVKAGAQFVLDADQIDYFTEFRRLHPLDEETQSQYYFANSTTWSYAFNVGADNQPATERTLQGSLDLQFNSNFRISTTGSNSVTIEFDSTSNSEKIYANVQTCSFGKTQLFVDGGPYDGGSYNLATIKVDDFYDDRVYSVVVVNDSIDNIDIRNNSISNIDHTQAHATVSPGNSTITMYLYLP